MTRWVCWKPRDSPTSVRYSQGEAEALTQRVREMERLAKGLDTGSQTPPQNVFGETLKGPRNYVRFRLGPDRLAVAIGARAKSPGDKMLSDETELFVCRQRHDEMGAYDRLIGDATSGDPWLFAQQDGVEASWQVVDPVLAIPTPVSEYELGSWRPHQSHALIAPFGGCQSLKEPV